MNAAFITCGAMFLGLFTFPACAAETPGASQSHESGSSPLNTLTEAEQKAGWRLLFNGKTTEGWRGYKMDKMPPGWKVIDGAGTPTRLPGGGGVAAGTALSRGAHCAFTEGAAGS